MIKKTAGGRRLIITKNLILMLVILVVILMAIFAWYSNNNQVTASGTSISAKAVDDVELAVPTKVTVDGKQVDSFPLSNDSWSNRLEFKTSGYLKNLVKDVTSNGQQFVVPNFEAASGLKEGRKVITDDVWVDGLSSKEALTNDKANDDDQYNYISLDFYLRSKTKNINVTAESFLAAGSELGYDGETVDPTKAKKLTGSDIYRCSSYGAAEKDSNAFSSDAIVGAMRVSLVGAPVDGVSTSNGVTTETTYKGGAWEDNSELKFLWLPRPDLYLQTDDDSNKWKLYTGIKPTDELAQYTYCHSFYQGETVTGGVKKGLTAYTFCDEAVKSVDNATSPDVFKVSKTNNDTSLGATGHYPTLGQSAAIANDALESSKTITFTAGTQEGDSRTVDGYYVYKYTLNIWIEGEDAEARRSMNNGVFSLELDFGT